MGSAENDVDNGGNQIPDSGDEEGPLVGPGAPVPVVRHKRPLEFEKAFLDSLPSAQMYEKSYMHRDVVTHVAVSSADFFMTGSCDGESRWIAVLYDIR
jgi:peptidylprolyl isomerase domain and WD repeat-containing protein 1